MKNRRWAYFVFVAALALILFVVSSRTSTKVCIGATCLQAENALGSSKRARGLMFRKSLPVNKGMLFFFPNTAQHTIWMKNMRFPLDIIWIDQEKQIVDIHKSALPCKDICKSLVPRQGARFVLEVNAGFTDSNGIKIGDKAAF